MKKRVGIIGGGIIGTATAYFLSQYPDAEVTLFEKNSIGSGTTAKSAATFCLIDDSVSHEFWSVRLFGFNFYTGIEKRFPGSTGFEKTGTLTVCPYKEYEMYVKQAIALTLASGYHAEYWTDAEKIHQIIPDLNLEGILGAGWCPDDGFFDATMTANTLARLAREAGVQIHIGTKVTGFTHCEWKSHRPRDQQRPFRFRCGGGCQRTLGAARRPAGRSEAAHLAHQSRSLHPGAGRKAGLQLPGAQVPALLCSQGQGQRLHLQVPPEHGPERPDARRFLGPGSAAHDRRDG